MSSGLAVVVTTAAVVAALSLAVPYPPTALAASHRCAGFSYHHKNAEGTYRFRRLTISGARCSAIKKVVLGYFKGRGRRAGPLPSDGYNVYGWNVLLHTSAVDGRRHGAQFAGTYTYTPD